MNGITRRYALGAGIAGVAIAAGIKVQKSAIAADLPALPLKVVVRLGGVNYEYREELGTKLQDFVSTIGGFTQTCVRSQVSGSPLTIFFRPDRNSDRIEIVFELGRIFNTSPANLGAYIVTISRNNQVIATVDVPTHYWFSRWRWQSSPRPIVGDVAALIAQNLLPPFDREGALTTVATPQTVLAAPSTSITTTTSAGNAVTVCTVTTTLPAPTPGPVPTSPTTPYTIMGTAGINPYMPQTGERPDIGIVTGAQAEYICTAKQTALDLVRAQAEAGGTMPWHMRDENTNAPINLKQYPGATWYSSTTAGQPYVKIASSPVKLDSAHQPALAYVPYLLTGDPYHLEDLQFQATWNIGTFVPQYRLSIPQSRTFAWNLRTLAQCARVTPAVVPSWLLPQQYWKTFLEDYRLFFEDQYVNNPKPERARFRSTHNLASSRAEGTTAPAGTWVSPWEDEFVATIMGWVVAMGFSTWQHAFEWKIGSTIARTNRTSGWIRAQATPYRLILRETADSPYADDWAGAWTLAQRVAKLTYANADTWVPPDMTYLTYTRGALVYIDKLKTRDVSENLAWATSQLNAKNWKTDYKWRLGKGLL